MRPPTVDRLGAALRKGDVIVQRLDTGDSYAVHRIDRIGEYPAARNKAGEPMPSFIGDHARIAYGPGEKPRWRQTIADHEHFHILADLKSAGQPPGFSLYEYAYTPPAWPRLVDPGPITDPALSPDVP